MARDAPFRVRRAEDLETVPLLWREVGSGTRAVVERALTKAGVRRRTVRRLDVALGSTEAILGGAVAGLGSRSCRAYPCRRISRRDSCASCRASTSSSAERSTGRSPQAR